MKSWKLFIHFMAKTSIFGYISKCFALLQKIDSFNCDSVLKSAFLNSNPVSVFFLPWWRASQSVCVLYTMIACFTKRQCSIYHDDVLHNVSVFYVPWWRVSQSTNVLHTMIVCFAKCQHLYTTISWCIYRDVELHKVSVFYIPW